jgi:hypothetical protein
MNTMGINIGMRKPKRFSGVKLQETTPKMRMPAKKPIITA